MTLLYIDGFEMNDFALRYANTGGASTNTTTRFGLGRSIGAAGGGLLFTKGITPVNRCIVGAAFFTVAGSSNEFLSFGGDAGATAHVQVRVTPTGVVAFYRGTGSGTLLAQTASPVVPFNTWVYLEASVTISDTVGVAKARVNGVEVLSFTGDTKNAGTASTVDTINFTTYAGGGSRFDDLYICDDTGAAPYNDFLGDVRVCTLSPTAPGSNTGLTPSVAPNWGCVDEQPYSATDFVTGALAALKDTYTMQDLPAAQVESVSVEALATASSDAVVESVWVEVLGAQTTVAQLEAVWAEVLVASVVGGSNVWSSTGVEQTVVQWDGAQLIPVTFTVG
jgi:hypothetical protein